MTPRITRQTKILIRDKKSENANKNSTKFAVITDPVPTVCLSHLYLSHLNHFILNLPFNSFEFLNLIL